MSRRRLSHRVAAAVAAAVLSAGLAAAPARGLAPAVEAPDPPFDGTIFLDPDIITAADPTTFATLTPTGRGLRTMYDRRVGAFVTVDARLFAVTYRDGLRTEVQVNPEFDHASAQSLAEHYAHVIGQLPKALRKDAHAVWVHGGHELFGGGNDSLLIHTEQAVDYEQAGILEETLVHEAAHTSLDAEHGAAPGWLAAQRQDPTYISTYARDHPDREDIAESFLPYLALRYRADRIDDTLAETFRETMPHRIAYFDRQGLSLGLVAARGRHRSRGPLDGWVREAPAASGVGARRNVRGTALRVGVDARDREHRVVLSFDTSALPDRAVVTGLTLRLRQTGVIGENPIGHLGEFVADLAQGGFGTPALRPRDFGAPATRTVSPGTSSGRGHLIELDLSRAGRAVSRTGLTQVRLRFSDPHPGDSAARLLAFASGDAARRLRPVLTAQYGTR